MESTLRLNIDAALGKLQRYPFLAHHLLPISLRDREQSEMLNIITTSPLTILDTLARAHEVRRLCILVDYTEDGDVRARQLVPIIFSPGQCAHLGTVAVIAMKARVKLDVLSCCA